MVTEDYVSFETAKLLKEKGFNESCYTSYDWNGWFHHDSCFDKIEQVKAGLYYWAPSFNVVAKWLRTVHNIHIEIRITDHSISEMIDIVKYYWVAFNAKKCRWIDESTIYNVASFKSYEEAYEDAIKHCLEKLI